MKHTIEELLALPDRELDVLAAKLLPDSQRAGYARTMTQPNAIWFMLDALAEGINGWEFYEFSPFGEKDSFVFRIIKMGDDYEDTKNFFFKATLSKSFPRLITAAFIFTHEQKEEKSQWPGMK